MDNRKRTEEDNYCRDDGRKGGQKREQRERKKKSTGREMKGVEGGQERKETRKKRSADDEEERKQLNQTDLRVMFPLLQFRSNRLEPGREGERRGEKESVEVTQHSRKSSLKGGKGTQKPEMDDLFILPSFISQCNRISDKAMQNDSWLRTPV